MRTSKTFFSGPISEIDPAPVARGSVRPPHRANEQSASRLFIPGFFEVPLS